MPDGLEDVQTFAARIKERFPDYADIDSYELVSRIATKYPDYRSRIKGFDIPGADELKLSPAMTGHYLRLYEQFEKAGVKPFVKKLGGFRTAEDENYLYRTGHPTMGNTGYGDKVSPHQEGRAIDFSFSPEQRARGRQIMAEYARQNGLHIPGTEPWHIALPKGQDLFTFNSETEPDEPPQQPTSRVPQPPTSIQSPKGVESTRRQLMTLTPKEKARLAGDVTLSKVRGGVPTMADVLSEAKSTPYTPSVRSQIAKQIEDEESTFIGNLKHGGDLFTRPLDILKSREQIINEEVERRMVAQGRANTPEMITARKRIGSVPGQVLGVGASPRGVAAALQSFAGSLLQTVAGVVNLGGYSPSMKARAMGDYLQSSGQILEESASMPLTEQGEIIERSLPEKATTAVTSLGLTVAQLALLKRATGWPLGRIMAVETALRTSDMPAVERSVEIAKAYGMGRVLDQHLSRPASAALFGAPTAIQTGTAYLQGKMTLEDALLQTGIQTGAGAIMGGKPRGVPESPFKTESRIDVVPDIPEVPVNSISEPRVVKQAQAERVSRVPEPPKFAENITQPITTPSEGGVSKVTTVDLPATENQVRLAQSPSGPETHPTVRRFLASEYKDKILKAIGADAEPLNPTELGGIKTSGVSFRKPDGSIVTVSDAAFVAPKAGDASYGNKRDGFIVSKSQPVESSASLPVSSQTKPSEISQNIRKVFAEPGRSPVTKWDRVVAYDLNLPDKNPVRVMMGIKGNTASVFVGPPRGKFMVEADEGNYRVPRTEMGTETALAVKRFVQREHPEITEFRFERGGSTGGEYGRQRSLTVPGQASKPPPQSAPNPESTPLETKPVASSTVPLKPLSPVAIGRESPISTERGTEVNTRYAIVEAPELVTSHDTMLNRNPLFPAELQPRERDRAASVDQINRIAQGVRPEYLGESPKASEGAPIVGPDGIVESGNGRVLGLRKAFEAGKADNYRQHLLDNAEAFGVDRAAIEAAREPVLVRLRQSPVDRPQFVRETNEAGVASMSAPEQAKSDAGRLTGALLDSFRPSESGEINTAANTPFIQAFMRDVVGPTELGRYVSAKGEVSQEGLARIRNAIFARAYGDSPEGLRALEKLAESPDNNVRNITTAFLQRAGQFAALKEGIAKGERYELDPTSDLTKALAKMSSLREQNTTVADYLNQRGLFGDDLTPTQKQMLWAFDEFKRSTRAISDVLDNYAKGAEAAGSPKQTAFFEKSPPTKEALLEAAIRETVRDANKEISLFATEGVSSQPETGSRVPDIDTASKSVSREVPQPDRSIAVERPAEAVESGIVPQQNLGPGAASIHERAPEVKERSFGVRFVEDERMVQELRDSIGTAKYYEPIPNDLTAENAREFVDSRGIPEAMKAIRDESNGMPFHVRSAAGQIVIQRLNEAIRNLKDTSTEQAKFALAQATDMAEWAMDYGTRLGQGVQSFAMWARLLPEGKLLAFKRGVEKAQQKFAEKRSGLLSDQKNGDEVKQIVSEMNQPTITITNAETAEGAQVIKNAIKRQLEKPTTGVPEPPEKEPTIWEQYKDSIAKQLADMAIPKKAKQSPPLQEFSERLLNNVEGLIQKPEKPEVKPDIYGQMREVIQNFDKYQEAWSEAISFIREKYENKLDMDKPLLVQEGLAELNNLERRITDLNSAFQTKAFDRVFHDAVKQAELNFREIAKSHYLDRQATRDDLVQKIQDGIGIKLTPEEAERMVSRVEQKLEARILRGREQILETLERGGNKTAKKVRSVSDKLIEAARVGILTEQKFYELAAEKLGLPKYDRATADKIYDFASQIEDAPEGLPKDKLIFELNKFIAQQKGFTPWDLPFGIYYGNILSGYNTNLVNTIDTALNVLSEINGLALNNPRDAAKIYSGLMRGLNEGRFDALLVMTEGRMITDGKWLEVPRLMEIAQFGKKGGVPIITKSRIGRAVKTVAESPIAYPLNAYKYATRLLAASDAVFYRGAKEARSSLLAFQMAEAEGLKGDALQARVREILALDRVSDFEAQAKREGFTGTEATVRAIELQELIRNKDLNSDAAEFAGEATYNHDPHGTLGLVSQKISSLAQDIPALKLFVPFTRIVANVTNRGLNYTPYGFKRALKGWGYGEKAEMLTPEAQRLMLTRATLGTAGLVTLGVMQHAGLLQIHGNGPSDTEQRRQLVASGWKPYSVQMGNTYISYVNTPVGLGLSILGNATDASRYHEMEQKDVGTRMAYAVARVGSTIFSQSFLSGLNRLFEALSDDPETSVRAVKGVLATSVQAFTTPNIVRDGYRLFDPKQYQSNSLMGDLVRNTPFAALALRPALNAFGEPVEMSRQRFVSFGTDDPAWRFVVDRGLRIPVPSRSTELKPEQRLTAEQYYSLLQTTGPEIKQWILDNRLDLSGMTEDAAQKALSKAAGDIHERALDRMEPSRLIFRTLFRGVPRPPEMASPSPTPQ